MSSEEAKELWTVKQRLGVLLIALLIGIISYGSYKLYHAFNFVEDVFDTEIEEMVADGGAWVPKHLPDSAIIDVFDDAVDSTASAVNDWFELQQEKRDSKRDSL